MSLKLKQMLCAVCLFHVFSFVWSEENSKSVLTVDDAVKTGLQSHVDVQRSSITLNQSKREYAHSWNNVLPDISVTGTGAEKRMYKDADSDTLSLNAGISADLSLDLGLGSAFKLLKIQYKADQTSYEDTLRSTECSIRQNFYNILYLKKAYESSKSTLESYQRQYDQTEQKYKRGVATELDLLTAQVNLETAKPDVDSAFSTYTDTLMKFLDTIGIEKNTDIELSGSLDYASNVISIDSSVLNNCVESSPDVKKLKDSLAIAEVAKKSSYYSTFFPSLSLAGSFYPESYSYEKKSETDTNNPYWNLSLGISLPIDNWIYGSSARDKVSALDDTVSDYKLRLADTRKTAKTSAIQKLKDIELSQKTVETRKLNVELAKKSYQMTEDAYNRGTKDLLTLQTSLDTLHTAELQLSSEQYTLISNVLDLEKVLSLPLNTFFTENK